ncbi:MAG: DUF2238 domain-containing protein [Pirellulales bacterium]
MNIDRVAVAVVVLMMVASLVWPIYPSEQLLQHIPTLPALVALAVIIDRKVLSRPAWWALLLFFILHVIGARYIYSFVPYDEIARDVSGRTMGWRRNHYDRFVHLAFGLLLVLPIAELAARHGRMPHTWTVLFAVSAVLALSALYESFEWALAVWLSPEYAKSYNGQ